MNRLLFFAALLGTLSRCTPAPASTGATALRIVPSSLPNREEERRIVISTLYFECRGESIPGRLAVASVIWNRAKAKCISLDAVCLAPKQFSCNNGGVKTPRPTSLLDREALEFFEGVAGQMVTGTFQPTTGADHYFNPALCNPAWGRYLKNREKIGNHVFGNCK